MPTSQLGRPGRVLPYISPRRYFPCISPILYLPYISPISPLYLPYISYLTRTRCAPALHMTENLVHPPVLQYRAISRNLRLFWDALDVICAWVPLGLAGGVVRGVNGGRRARSRPNLAKFQNLRTPSGMDEI